MTLADIIKSRLLGNSSGSKGKNKSAGIGFGLWCNFKFCVGPSFVCPSSCPSNQHHKPDGRHRPHIQASTLSASRPGFLVCEFLCFVSGASAANHGTITDEVAIDPKPKSKKARRHLDAFERHFETCFSALGFS